jgi:hypothetical protein
MNEQEGRRRRDEEEEIKYVLLRCYRSINECKMKVM